MAELLTVALCILGSAVVLWFVIALLWLLFIRSIWNRF